MKKFIIVGRGLAATCLMHQFNKEGISFVVLGNQQLSQSSLVAAGIWNPIVFKRLTSSWLAERLVPYLIYFYHQCESTLKQKLITERELLKPFTEDQEKMLWIKKANNELTHFMDQTIYDTKPEHLHFKIANQYGKVKKAGSLDVAKFIHASELHFKDLIHEEIFDHSELKINTNSVSYKSFVSENIIFCEGHLVKNNPYFNWIPLKPAKGEIISIKTEEILLKNFVFNRDGFIMDTAANNFKVGATYEWQDLNDFTTNAGLFSLKAKLNKMLDINYEVLKHEAGVRPSSIDRRPIIGQHPKYKHLYVFNGLGAKGVMLAPFFTENFVHFCLQKALLHKEVNINRFYHLYESTT